MSHSEDHKTILIVCRDLKDGHLLYRITPDVKADLVAEAIYRFIKKKVKGVFKYAK